MTLKDWVGKSVEDTTKEIKNLREELFALSIKKATGQLEKTHRLREIKRNIARGLTYIKQQAAAAK